MCVQRFTKSLTQRRGCHCSLLTIHPHPRRRYASEVRLAGAGGSQLPSLTRRSVQPTRLTSCEWPPGRQRALASGSVLTLALSHPPMPRWCPRLQA